MKKIVFLIALSLSILSCSKVKKGEFLISGEAKGLPNGKMIFLKTQNDVGLVLNVDSAKVQDGKFELKGTYFHSEKCAYSKIQSIRDFNGEQPTATLFAPLV